MKILRDVRHWLNQVLPPRARQTAEPGKRSRPSSRRARKAGCSVTRQERQSRKKRPEPAAPDRERTGYGTLAALVHVELTRMTGAFLF
ncbi:MAG: hypothetical protein ACLTW9_13945 [Enterocloster sp.]